MIELDLGIVFKGKNRKTLLKAEFHKAYLDTLGHSRGGKILPYLFGYKTGFSQL